MIFKMLILLGFFAAGTAAFIHSDIHRSIVQFDGYPGTKMSQNARRFA
jgi:hypothetical protein